MDNKNVNKTVTENEKTDTELLAEALQISQSELEEKVKNIYSDYKEKNKSVRFFDRKLYTTIGLIIMAMALVGLFWTVFNGVVFVKGLFKPDYNEYFDLIEPTVISDMSAFENSSEISDRPIITAAVWEIILHGNLENYSKSFDVVFVPKTDIEKAAQKIFADVPEIEHQTIKIGDYTILFNEDKQQYVVHIKPDYFAYYSKIKKVSENKNTLTLTVAVFADTPKWQENLKRIETSPVKYLQYTIVKNKITKIKNVSADYGLASEF